MSVTEFFLQNVERLEKLRGVSKTLLCSYFYGFVDEIVGIFG